MSDGVREKVKSLCEWAVENSIRPFPYCDCEDPCEASGKAFDPGLNRWIFFCQVKEPICPHARQPGVYLLAIPYERKR